MNESSGGPTGARPDRAIGKIRTVKILLLALLLSMAACAEKVDHDAQLATRRAEEFARVVFVNQNLEKGYPMLAEGTRRYVSIGQFKEVISKLHPNGYPTVVRATGDEPMKGEKAIYIYLTGENSGRQFYYRLTMEGTAATDYRVLRFDRSDAPRQSSGNNLLFGGTK
jgi:hypothetical protein